MSKDESVLKYSFPVLGGDFSSAGSVSTRVKRILRNIGVRPDLIRKVAIATYEAEMNVAIHAAVGEVTLTASPYQISVRCADEGPGIPDIDLAMKPGWSTASDKVREMGFGAGMGLPNMDRCADSLRIESEVGIGTTVEMTFNNE